ncbi:Mis12-Mtw1 protein family-domain-containing protein [Crucibulum laeve]|uniref:Mis12-Mtw1 protein family-domain-containing protein n=1 Tax=Crucibulum laeve TaxID=68775 RepID=A0A5C3LW12_9AGAR|nr:Mis12-Mtw1 protein family-domain-containing protein [Crucibulum laeve]
MTILSSATLTSLAHRQMLPSDSQPTAKRKATDDSNPLLQLAKRKKESKGGASNKRKLLNAEETPGGLLIVRAPSVPVSQPNTSNPLIRPPSQGASAQLPTTVGAGPSKPPSKKFRAESQPPASTSNTSRSRPQSKSTARDRLPPAHEDPELENDVRAMDDEADQLRRHSRAHTTIDSTVISVNPAFQFPARAEPSQPKPKSKKGKPKIVDTSLALPENETPQIERNKLLRSDAMAAIVNGREKSGDGHRRKSSLSRGKRISSSFESTGVITQPHNSVSDSSFYKHIDCDLPESERMRQLLIWCSLRASGSTLGINSSTPSKSKPRPPPASTTSLPPLSAKSQGLLREVQDDLVRMLAEKRIDLSLYGPEASGSGSKNVEEEILKENEQNVRNRKWEVTYTEHIKKAQEEDEAWKKVRYDYDAYMKKIQASISKPLPSGEPPTPSAKAQGKQRATDSDPSSWKIREYALPPDLQRAAQLAKSVLSVQQTGDERVASSSSSHLPTRRQGRLSREELDTEIARLMPDMQFKLDQLHTYANAARATTDVAERMLTERFELIGAHLAARSSLRMPTSTGGGAGEGGVAGLLRTYSVAGRGGSEPEPRDLLRALSRIDQERPPAMVGDAARQAAREVQRAGESGAGAVGDRRLTGVPVSSTPRKAPGTPRRGGTPGRDRER